jgi:hypothetical protein
MADDPGQAAPLRPPAVAIHDDRDVPGQLCGIQADRPDPRQAHFADAW